MTVTNTLAYYNIEIIIQYDICSFGNLEISKEHLLQNYPLHSFTLTTWSEA
jgi:hypothetical protein